MSELELKYIVPSERAAAIEAALERLGAVEAELATRYFDTPDRHLARAGVSLRLRRAGKAWEQTMKAPGASAVDRHEDSVVRPGRWLEDGPPLAPGLHGKRWARAAFRRALGEARPAPERFQLVCETTVRRLSTTVQALGAIVEVAFDRGEIRAGGRHQAICEVEYELKAGPREALIGFARRGVADHGLWLSTAAKWARGESLARGGPVPAVKARPPALDPTMSDRVLLRAMVAACTDQIAANVGEIASGRVDEEAVHQLRVGLRRLRTVLRELAGPALSFDRRVEMALDTAFRALGDYRDVYSVTSNMAGELVRAGSPEPVLAVVSPPDTAMLSARIRGRPFQEALLDVLAFTLRDPEDKGTPKPAGRRRLRRQVAARLDKLKAQLARGASHFGEFDELERHQVRKRLKRLRYLAELVGPLYLPGPVRRHLAALRPAQDALGHYLDLVVALRIARRAVAAGDAKAWFNVGWLTGYAQPRVAACSEALRQAARAPRFWRASGR